MARYVGPVCRLCRREGEKLFLKGERCFSKCTLDKREGRPGQHGKGRQQFSNFKVQLRQKQKSKTMYGVAEKQFRSYYEVASKSKGVTGTELLTQLELRLDNIAYRLGFGASRRQSRQVVRHGLLLVNGKKINIPSYILKVGDTLEVKDNHKKDIAIVSSVSAAKSRLVPEWLSLDEAAMTGSIKALPTREQMPQNVNEQLIVELYSR
jgi:small subunit ribosomal protein S4